MKNLNYFPCERNHYYYGKLLTEQDFTQEQKYMNDKRRIGNRFLHGAGVMAGLRVVAVDEKSISVEAGAALDFSGREILVDTPVIRRLSLLDGFETAAEDRKQEYVYLCIEYDERGTAPSYNVTSGGFTPEEKADCDRVREEYHLYLTEEEPDLFYQRPEALYEKQVLLFSGDGIFVRQTAPALVKAGEEFPVTIEVENRGADRKLSLSLEEELICGFFGESRTFEVKWTDLYLEKTGKAEKTFLLRAMTVEQGEVRLELKTEKLSLTAGSRKYKNGPEAGLSVPIVSGSLWEEACRRFSDGAMDEILKHNYPQGIYLARIYLIKTGGAYMIGRVEQNPFGQYVESGKRLAGTVEWLRDRVEVLEEKKAGGKGGKDREEGARGENSSAAAFGFVTLDLGIGGKRGQRYFSDEIFHGLGLGYVQVELAVCEDELLYSGSSEVFEEMKIKAELAVRLNQSAGSFMVGARLLEPSSERRLKIRWTAVRLQKEEEKEKDRGRLYIRPGVLNLKVRESFYLETDAEGMVNPGVIWAVRSKDGGTITQDGLYTAPNEPGVYEITAVSEENPDIRAALFVIVRE